MAAKADSTTAYVYVVASDAGPLKIGWTGRPKARLASIQNGAHSALRFAFLGRCLSPSRIERHAHRRLAAFRLHGEWFDVAIDNAIAAVKNAAAACKVKMTDCTVSDLPAEAEITVTGTAIIVTQIVSGLASAEIYARAEKSKATLRAYESDLRDFAAWCQKVSENVVPARPEAVAAYIAHLADAKKAVSTIVRRLAAIAYAHRHLDHDDPTASERVRSVTRGIRRTLGTAPKQKAPATSKFVKAMLKGIPDTMIGRRDRALILIGFAGALRRSELVALDLADIERQPEGILVHIRRSKTDQEGAGQTVAIPRGSKLKPVEALDEWLEAAAITSGPVFRPVNRGGRALPERLTDQSVALVIKARAEAAKLDPRIFSGHSLRAGFVTSALEAGADTLRVMSQTRHQSVETLKKYDRRAKAFVDHAGKGFL